MTGPDRVIRTTATLPDRNVARLADELGSMKTQVDTIMRAMRAAQLGNSSIDNGALVIFDEFGLERLRLGNQGDGTFVSASLNNPNPPPVPNMPIVEAGTGIIKVTSAGFTGGVPAPLDFAYFTVYVAPLNETDRVDGTITTDPGSWIVDTGGQFIAHTIWLTATNLSGRESEPSEVATATPTKVVSDAILDGAITELQIAADAVTAAKVKAGNIGSSHFAGQSVTLAALANGSVDATKLLDGAVTNPKIAANAVAAGQIAAGAIVAGTLAANSVTANELAASSVTAIKLAADSVAAGKIAADAVTAREILALAITSDKIAVNAITAGHIAAGSVTASKFESVLNLSTRFVAGSPTGTRSEMNGAGFEAWSGTTQTFDVDAVTGNVMILGLYKTAQSGTRIELGGSTGADMIRFYPGGGSSAYAKAESFPDGSNAGISLQASGATSSTRVGTVFCRRTYASIAMASSSYDGKSELYVEPNFVRSRSGTVDLIVDEGVTALQGPRRVSFIYYTSSEQTRPSTHLQYMESEDDRPWLWGVQQNAGIKFWGGEVQITNGSSMQFGTLKAGVVAQESALASKENISDVTLADERTAWDVVEGAPAFDWNYIGENTRPERPTNPDGTVVTYREPNPALSYRKFRNLPPDDPEKYVTVEAEWVDSPPATKRHRFPMADDLLALDSSLAMPTSRPDDIGVDLRDMVGVLWDAVDMLIKRTRVLENALTARNITVPPRPQRGDVVGGVGHVVPGRTRRDIDPETGQYHGRRPQ